MREGLVEVGFSILEFKLIMGDFLFGFMNLVLPGRQSCLVKSNNGGLRTGGWEKVRNTSGQYEGGGRMAKGKACESERALLFLVLICFPREAAWLGRK